MPRTVWDRPSPQSSARSGLPLFEVCINPETAEHSRLSIVKMNGTRPPLTSTNASARVAVKRAKAGSAFTLDNSDFSLHLLVLVLYRRKEFGHHSTENQCVFQSPKRQKIQYSQGFSRCNGFFAGRMQILFLIISRS